MPNFYAKTDDEILVLIDAALSNVDRIETALYREGAYLDDLGQYVDDIINDLVDIQTGIKQRKWEDK